MTWIGYVSLVKDLISVRVVLQSVTTHPVRHVQRSLTYWSFLFDISIPSISEDRARESFSSYVSSKCCYSSAPVKEGVIANMETFNTYRVRPTGNHLHYEHVFFSPVCNWELIVDQGKQLKFLEQGSHASWKYLNFSQMHSRPGKCLKTKWLASEMLIGSAKKNRLRRKNTC